MAQEFSTRFARHKDELEWLFMELYNNREGLEVLEREMADAYDARSAELKALDKARAADPNWYKRGNMFGMTMYTDPRTAQGWHQPVSGFCYEPHRQHPPLGDGGQGGRPVVSSLLPPV